MSNFAIALRSLIFHKRVNLAIALGVAAATAVLTGALIVGDSMRGSLRQLTLDRLGKVDLIIFSEGFFREELATELQDTPVFQQHFDRATPGIMFPNGTAELSQQSTRKNLGQVNLFGIHQEFWKLGSDGLADIPELRDGEVIINSVVAEDLGISEAQLEETRITIGVPKQLLLPADSALGSKKDLVERIVDLQVVRIVPAESLGRFGLHPTQIPPRNVYLPISAIQEALHDGILKHKPSRDQANVIFVSGQDNETIDADVAQQLANAMRPQIPDLGLSLKRASRQFNGDTIFDYYSLASDRLVLPTRTSELTKTAFPDAVELFTYLSNEMVAPRSEIKGIPFSMVTALDFDRVPLPSVNGGTLKPLGSDEIAITSWAAEDQGLKVGDMLKMYFFEPETTHGDETEVEHEFRIVDIVALTEPSRPPEIDRRQGYIPAEFSQPPTMANDPDMTPTVPGLTDAESIDRWDLPFETAPRLRRQDDVYWTNYRTTPKAYVSLATARALWSSRFGQTTSFRIPVAGRTKEQVSERLLEQFREAKHLPGIQLVPIKYNGLRASSGSTPFDVLFLSLSMFVIAAALALVSLLFRLALQQRSSELGTLLANGFTQRQIRRIWLMEMLGVCLFGSVLGIGLGIGYAALMLYGLKTWWVGAITTPFLNMHINWWTLPAGMLLGLLICLLTIYLSVRGTRKQTVNSLLRGQIGAAAGSKHSQWTKYSGIIIAVCGVLALVLAGLAAFTLAGESQAGAFMSSGFLVLVAGLFWIHQRLQRAGIDTSNSGSISRLARTNAARNPLRSTLTIGLVAVASFLILAISAFRLAPDRSGTAGFDYLATTSQPVFANLNSAEGQRQVLVGDREALSPDFRGLSFRYKAGEDASCNNPYQSSQPQVLGVTDETIQYFGDESNDRFSFSMTSEKNPWELLTESPADGAIPVIIDKNTAWYSLKVYMPGSEFTVAYDSGETVRFRLVGLLSNSVLQGSLLISEANFNQAFPDLSGYRYFLLRTGDGDLDQLSNSLSDQGFDAQSTRRLLAGFLAVQNTYLSTFQTLGLLGLLLGTFGLAAVQLRSVLERRKELGLMRAVGFTRHQLAGMILTENAWLLLVGMFVGIVAALVTTLPHYFFGDASVPWLAILAMFAFIAVVGLLTSWLASRTVFRAPLIESLRAG